jgi:L-histidine N-alpha-methyltransferase
MIYEERYNGRLRLYSMDAVDAAKTFSHDVRKGLSAKPKVLPAKYFYDVYGSQLYEKICTLPEYYPYRAEQEILATFGRRIHDSIGHLPLVELGPGNAAKTRYLLAQYESTGDNFVYCPVEIERNIMLRTADLLLADFPHLAISALHADFAQQPEVIQHLGLDVKAIAFLGSSMGNFTTSESLVFLQRIEAMMGVDDVFLLGIDLKKSPCLLIPAYDDAQGVTAAFNLNLLRRINRELGGNFDLETFEHVALYNESLGRVEMHLRSLQTQSILITRLAQAVHFRSGETIHTENSYKYSLDEIRSLAAQANLRLEKTWLDQQDFFLVALFRSGL